MSRSGKVKLKSFKGDLKQILPHPTTARRQEGDAWKERREDLFCSGHMKWNRDLEGGEESFKNLMNLRDSTVVPLQRSLFRSHFKSISQLNQFTFL